MSIFRVNGARPSAVVVAFSEDEPDIELDWPPMLLAVQGVASVLEPRELGRLLATPVPRQPATTWTDSTRRLWVLHLQSPRSEKPKRIEIGRDETGVLLARDVESTRDRPMSIELDRTRFSQLSWQWPLFDIESDAGETTERDIPLASVVELAQPLTSAWITLNETNIKKRLTASRSGIFVPTDRELADVEMYARLPAGYTPEMPAGVIVWIDAADFGPPRRELFAAADEHNLICVSVADVGNTRKPADRFQLVLDAVHVVRTRFHVDQERIYTSGISGGARISTIMAQCFPDIFAGAVADVALSSYRASSAGNGLYWRAEFGRPSRSLLLLLKDRRIAGITGEDDGNFESIQAHARDMNNDGLDVRIFEYDMGHEMCTSEQFAEALAWVDERVQLARQKDYAQAAKAMEIYQNMIARPNVDKSTADRQLFKVIELAAWTNNAWRACEEILARRSDQ